MDAHGSKGPLDGIRIVEMTLMVAGPTCGVLLSHLGAEVIKIESAARGVQVGAAVAVEQLDTLAANGDRQGLLGIAMEDVRHGGRARKREGAKQEASIGISSLVRNNCFI